MTSLLLLSILLLLVQPLAAVKEQRDIAVVFHEQLQAAFDRLDRGEDTIEDDEEADEEEELRFYHQLQESVECTEYCIKKQGDGRCDPICNVGKCQYDLNDCIRFRTVCSKEFCPHDGKCRPACEIEGCSENTCDLSERLFKVHAIVSANVHPFDLFERFEKVEHILSRHVKFNVVVQARGSGPLIFGYKNDSSVSEIMHMNRTVLGPYMDLGREFYQKKSVIVLLLDSPRVVTYEDESTLKALCCLGSKRVHGEVGLYPITRKDLVGYSPDYIHDYRMQQRAEREQRVKERRARRHTHKTGEKKENN